MDSLIGKPLHIDCFELLAQLPDESINLAFLDPPYNIGVFCKMPESEYLAWCEKWIAETSRVLVANGAFWISHKDPAILVELSRIIAEHGRKRVNWVTWDKYNGCMDSSMLWAMNKSKINPKSKRAFDGDAEYLIYHADEGDWVSKCDKERGFIFEPILQWFLAEWKASGLSRAMVDRACATSNVSQYWFLRRNFQIPTLERYRVLQGLSGNGSFCREYEDLRREYENLRYTFNNPGKVSSVWQIPPASRNGHPTPKPEQLMERIIETTSNPGDTVLDFFAGSFTTAVLSQRLGREWICGDNNGDYVEMGNARLVMQLELQDIGWDR